MCDDRDQELVMNRTFARVLNLLVLTALFGCGDDQGPTARYSDWAQLQRTQVDAVCDCYQEFGWDRRSECVASHERIGPSQETCATEAIAADRSGQHEFASCLMPLQTNFRNCVDEQLDCADPQSLATCRDDFEVGADRCQLPAAVRRDVEDCGVHLESLGRCTDTCSFAADGDCDDGGPDADFNECGLGTDCTDCGPR
jgi:hypothetical protein